MSKANANYRSIRAELIRQGYTVASWARSHSFRPTTVYDAAQGKIAGIKAMAIMAKLEETIR